MNTDLSEKLLQEEERALRIEESVFGLQKGFGVSGVGGATDDIAEIEEVLDDSELLLGVINKQVTGKRIWQIGCVCLAVVLAAGCFVCYNLYASGERQLVELSGAEDNIQTAGAGLLRAEEKIIALEAKLADSQNKVKSVTTYFAELNAKAAGKVKALEAGLADSKVELERVKGQLAVSQNEVKGVEGKLAESNARAAGMEKELVDTSARLKDLQNRNEEVVRKMRERLEQL